MAQTEDILEQIVEEYLTHEGYFVQHNIKFKPDPGYGEEYDPKKDSVPRDIDVLAIHPNRSGHEKVMAVNVKSWQSGFAVDRVIIEIERDKTVAGRPTHLSLFTRSFHSSHSPSGADVVGRSKVLRRLCEPVSLSDFGPSELLGKSAAHQNILGWT
jgi:hypothetical protein